jgi:periplasmic protein TonB
VKRLIPAATIAIGIHILLMSMDSDWMNSTEFKKPSTGSVTILLESVQSQTIKPISDSIPPDRFSHELKNNAIPKAPKTESPLDSTVRQKPVEPVKKPEKKPPMQPSAPAQPAAPSEPQKPAEPNQALPTSHKTLPNGSAQESEAPLQAPQEESTAIGSGPLAAVSSQPDALSTVEEALPEYDRNPPISYPRSARQKGYKGTVILEVLVSRNGMVNNLRILTSSGYDILDRSAVKTVKTWSFKPAKKGKETVEMWVRVPIQFNLE